MKFVMILTAFLFYNFSAISQTEQKKSASKTTKTTKSTNKRLKSVLNNPSGPGIENTGTKDIDVKRNDTTQNAGGSTKAGTRKKTRVTKNSGTKRKS